jgi:hypothetical protein
MEKKYPIEPALSPEQELIYRIVEQWGNVINMPKMVGWLKEYAAQQAPTGAVCEVYDLVFAPCAEDDQRSVGCYTSHDGESHCNVREMYVPVKPTGSVWVKASERLPSPANPPVLIPVKRYEADPTQYSVRAMTANQLADIIKWDRATFEWLDESAASR